MRFSFLIFDLDGTLVDSAPDLAHAVNRVLNQYGRAPLGLAQIKAMIGDGAVQLVSRALAASSIEAAETASALTRFFEFYEADPTLQTTLYPGVLDTLRNLAARGFRLAVCTNKPAAPAGEILRRLEVAPYFERVIGGDTWPFRKPDPRMLTDLIRDCEAQAQHTLMIGDSEVDAATATASGVAFALMSFGYRRGPSESIAKLVQFDRFKQLLAFVIE